jgi:predicted outer membrane repeat protein
VWSKWPVPALISASAALCGFKYDFSALYNKRAKTALKIDLWAFIFKNIFHFLHDHLFRQVRRSFIMKNPMKKTWVTLAAALIMAAGMGCASHFQMGMNALEKKDYDKAIAEFTEEIRSNPKDAATYNNRGYAYIMTGELNLAIADFEKSLKIRPGNKDAAENLSKARKRLENQTQAQQQPPATVTYVAPAAKTAAADDELDIAIRDASDYLNDNIPRGSKIVILNIESTSANLSEYIIDELIANAVNDKNFSVVDRRQLEAIQSEQKFQMSGAVDDKDALAIGKFFGAQTIISGAMRDIGSRYRMTIRALSVQTAQVQGQYNRNMAVSEMLAGLANSTGGRPATSAVATTSNRATQAPAAVATTSSTTPAAPPIQGTMVPGESLADKLVWLSRSADSHNTYILEVNADENIAPHTFEFSGGINITIVLRGVGENRMIRLRSDGTMFTVREKVTFILDNNITLHGHSGNSGSMVYVNGGTFKMNAGSTITGNDGGDNGHGGGVYVKYGIFEMTGGTISGNSAVYYGGGVYNYGTFTMSGGTISGNTAAHDGGGVYSGGTFTMRSGTITGNTARKTGGGVVLHAMFNLSFGGFTKTGGTITGYSSDQNNGNVVKDADGYILARKGHAVFINENTRKETTSGPNANMSYGDSKGTTGAWDQ